MGKVQHIIAAGKRYGQLMAERLARIAAEAEAMRAMRQLYDIHDAHVLALIAKAATMSGRELLAAGLLWTRPELCRGLLGMVGLTESDNSARYGEKNLVPAAGIEPATP